MLGSLLVLASVCGGCGGDEGGSSSTAAARPASDAATSDESVPKTPFDPATAGTISGRVVVKGTVPAPKPLAMIGEAWCGQQHPDGHDDDRLIVGADGGLDNAFVWISAGLEDLLFPLPDEQVVVDQHGCLFTPRVVGVRVGQELIASNSDAVMHNVHTKPELNRPQNFGMPAGSTPRELRLRRPEVMVEVVCDVHAWMKAWVGVLDHPCFAVTGPDGSYRVPDVPPGEYTLNVWHESLGTLDVDVTMQAGEDLVLNEIAFKL